MSAKLGDKAEGPMPDDGRAYVVVDGKWVAVESDEADGIPADLSSLPDAKGSVGRGGETTGRANGD